MIEFRALGTIDLRAEDGRAIQSVLAQEKRLALLTYLTVSRPGEFCRRDRLLGIFWPESDESRARNSLSQALFQLRRSLGDKTIPSRGAEEVGVDGERLWCDVVAFERAAAAGELAKAIDLYRGPLLDGLGPVADAPEWEHWLEAERARLRRVYTEALRELARRCEAAGDLAGAAQLWLRLGEEAPFDAVAALHCMRALAEGGDRVGALEYARTFQARLRDEFDADPDPEVTALAERLRAGPAVAASESRPTMPPSPPHPEPPSRPPATAARTTLPAHGLPLPPTPLIGRTREMEEVHRTLMRGGVRLLTLTGPGGVGKTRLGIEVARTFLADHSHDVVFVAMTPLTAADLVLPAIGAAVGVREVGGRPLADALREHFGTRRTLLVLDNFEHLPEAAPEIAGLLTASPRLKVLVTSRASLRLSMEHEFPVSPLALPDPALAPAAEELLLYGAIELFVARARAVKPDFELTASNASSVAEICARLDGLPLAIELAAARTRILSPPSLVARLGKRLQLLTGGARDLPARQQTLRNAIEWSYDLLTEPERGLFRRLAVFRGGSRVEAIETVCADGDVPDGEVLDLLDSLVSKSLVSRAETGSGEVRFFMLETLAEYAGERLLEHPFEAEATLQRHTELFVALAEEAEPQLMGGEQAQWLGRLEEEHDNLRAVLERAQERKDALAMLRLSGALWRFWWMHGHLSEGRRWTNEALKLAQAQGDTSRWRARAALAASALALYQGDLEVARTTGEQALRTFEKLGDREGIATALSRLGQEAWKQGDFATARQRYDQSLEILRQLGQKRAVAGMLFSMGTLEIDQGRFDEARRFYAECLALNEELGDRELNASVLLNLGTAAYRAGDLEAAKVRLEEGIGVARMVGSKQHLAGALNTLGLVARDLGDHATARVRLEESYTLQRELGDRLGLAHAAHSLGSVELRAGRDDAAAPMLRQSLHIFHEIGIKPPAECLADLGELALAQGRLEQGIRLLGAASRLIEQAEAGMAASDHARFERSLAQARERVGTEAWQRAWAEGCTMHLDDAIRQVLAESSPLDASPSPGGSGE